MSSSAKRRKHEISFFKSLIDNKILLVLFLFVLITSTFITSEYLKDAKNITLRTSAQLGSCTCPAGKCYSDCSRGTALGICGDDLAGYGPDPAALGNYCYKEAECCKYGAMNCCWAERKYCLPASCGGSQKNGCSNAWGDNFPSGCLNAPVRNDGELPMDRNGNKIGSQPTAPPVPTAVPTKTPAGPPPFVGCVSEGEWLCQCYVPPEGWRTLECSVLEDGANKQAYIARCGGDKEKAKLQWKWDIAIRDKMTDLGCCGGQNVCPLAVQPTTPYVPPVVTPDIPTNPPVPTTNNPSPTTHNSQPTTYIPPTQVPIDDYDPQPRPTDDRPLADTTPNLVQRTIGLWPTQPTTYNQQRIIPDPKPIINNIAKSVNQFIQKTQNSLKQFFATILP